MLFRYIYIVTTAVIFKFAVMKSLYPGAISPVWAWNEFVRNEPRTQSLPCCGRICLLLKSEFCSFANARRYLRSADTIS